MDLSPAGIAKSDGRMVARQHAFRCAADTAAKALIPFKEVQAVALFGPVAVPLWKEIPDIEVYRRTGIALWHECARIDLAVWLDRFNQLSAMRTAIIRALTLDRGPAHQVTLEEMAVNLFEHGTDRHVGNLCAFKACPADKPACEVPGCGAVGHLRQFRDHRVSADSLAPENSLRLFDRATSEVRRAADLPGPNDTRTRDTA